MTKVLLKIFLKNEKIVVYKSIILGVTNEKGLNACMGINNPIDFCL